MTNKEENFIKENSIIFKKYRVKKKLGEGAFGDVYIGSSIENNELVAIKVEQRKIAKPLLETEAFFLYSLRGLGIPEVLSFGRLRNYNVLVEPLLDKSLFDLFAERRKRLALEDICLIAKQVIDRIQWVHSKNIVHRDIKPDNFLIGRKDPNVIYLIDFGLSKKYKSSTTGKHIKFGFTGKLTGTVRFASANALRGGEQSRRDDLESIGYMIIFFMRGRLPWQGVTGNKKMERYLKIYKMKKNVAPEDLCKSLPKQMTDFMRYVKQLEFEQEPDYNYLRNLFNSIIKKIHDTSDLLIFSWIKTADLPNLKNPINPATRRDSPQSRLYRKIETKLKNERNTSSDNDSGQKSIQTCTMIMNNMNSNMRVIDNNNLSKDDIEDIKLKTKKDKSKEGLNTMIATLNKTIDENIVDFGEDDKVNKVASNDCSPINIKSNLDGNNSNFNKNKNKTVNESINFKSEKKNLQNFALSSSPKKENEKINDKKEDMINPNSNDNKEKELEKETKEINQNNKGDMMKDEEKKLGGDNPEQKENREIPENNKENQNLLTKVISEDNTNINFANNLNNVIKDNLPKENDSNKTAENHIIENNDKINEQNLIPQNNDNADDTSNLYNSQNINNNIKICNNNSTQKNIKLIKNKNSNEILIDKKNVENQSQNKIQNQKKSITIVKKLNDVNDINFNNHSINLMTNSKENKSKKDPNNIQIKDLLKGRNNNNNINIIQKGKKTFIGNGEEPFDNMRNIKKMEKNKFIKLNSVQVGENINVPMNTGNNSSKNVSDFKINNIKDMNNNLEANIDLNNKMVTSSKKMKNRYQKKNTDYTENKNLNTGLDLLPKNSDFVIESGSKDILNYTEKSQKMGKPNNLKNVNNSINLENYFNENFNEHKKKKKMISNSVNVINMNSINNHMDNYMNTSNRMNNSINNNMNNPNNNMLQNNKISSNINIKENNSNYMNNKNSQNNINNSMNNNMNNHINNNKNGNNVEFNNNRKIRLVNRNRNPNLNSINSNNMINDNNNLDYMNLNTLHKTKSKIKADNNSMNNIVKRKNYNNSINMNINNNINNNIIINNNINNNIYERGNNTVLMNNNNQGINPANYILNKRPSHNINSKMIHSFNNLNQIEFTKRPSCDIKTNSYISINQIGVNKRPSYNTNLNVSNFLNNNGVQMMMGNTKIKKLNNNSINKVGGNINSNSVDKRLKMQQNQLYHLNAAAQNNNTFTNIRPINNNILNKYNMPSSNMNYQVYQSLQNKGQIGMMGQVGPMITIGQIDQTKQMNPQTQIFNPNIRNNAIIGTVSNISNFQNQVNQMGNNPNQFNNNNAQFYGYRNF